MRNRLVGLFAAGIVGAWSAAACAAGRYFEVSYEPSAGPGALEMGVTYTLWVPDGATKILAVIVHQHGCGVGSGKNGATAAYDLHWQSLAQKWNAALLGPAYHQAEKQNCRLWCDPRNGSDKTFLRALADLGAKSGHPELANAPWCLWGHSGGGFWASLMQTMHPERIVAIWFRSGTAFGYWQTGEVDKPALGPAVYAIPCMGNPGSKEEGHARFNRAWTGTWEMFQAYRAQGAPIGFAPDPRTAHETGDSRYLAILFFDACLAMRLPDANGTDQALRPVDKTSAWLATPLTAQVEPAGRYRGDARKAVWLPNERVARAWAEYVATGAVGDSTPPAAPCKVRAARGADGSIDVTWDAAADFESGLAGFIIERDGVEIARLPEKPVERFGRPLFQGKTYGDTPEPTRPEMRYADRSAPAGAKPAYRVVAVNSVGLKSEPSQPATP